MSSGKSRILIVDDERVICELISRLLEEEGMVPLVAYDGQTALQKIRAESPEALILDLRLPDLDGMEILR